MTSLLFTPPALGTVLSLTGLPGGSNKIHDRSPYGNTATIVGATWVRLPSGLWCLNFDGSDDVVACGNGTGISGLTIFTLMAWVKLDTIDTEYGIFGKWTGSIATCAFLLEISSSNHLKLFTSDGSSSAALEGAYTFGTTDFVHCVGVYDGANSILYINGAEDAAPAAKLAPITVAQGLAIGAYKEPASGRIPLAGDIALPKIYNYALNAFDIQKHFEKEKHLFGG